MNQEEFKQKLKEKFPNEEFTIIYIGKNTKKKIQFLNVLYAVVV